MTQKIGLNFPRWEQQRSYSRVKIKQQHEFQTNILYNFITYLRNNNNDLGHDVVSSFDFWYLIWLEAVCL